MVQNVFKKPFNNELLKDFERSSFKRIYIVGKLLKMTTLSGSLNLLLKCTVISDFGICKPSLTFQTTEYG